MKTFEEKLASFVKDCQRIIKEKRKQDDLARREAALRVVLALGPEIDPEPELDFSHD